ncbi:60S ribosomal protein L5-like [Schistocerca gregaria]|uniref:60S ribosomal protein L5-like n=1 Tax=Schistocerca gregaria TaxID=7010 RepID=UPI00211E1B43|nr:60S ribosomal protein L5-like [Schistocerca gregaria]
MPFVKVIKNTSYFKRYQVKYRRRREGLTDYQARKNLIVQDLTKYGAPKYRLVVRFTNKDIIAQIVFAKIKGDFVLCAAYSHELPRYGIKLGLTNYAAAYATGLLLARRTLVRLNLADKYIGNVGDTGEDFSVEPADQGPRPFRVLLDIGLVRSTTGHRVFGAMKGALDGGLNIPHSPNRFVGYFVNKDSKKESEFDPSVLRKYIFGGHVSEYMQYLQNQDEGLYQKQFSKYISAGIDHTQLENIYKNAHAAIRADPSYTKKVRNVKPKRYNIKKSTYEERKARVKAKLSKLMAKHSLTALKAAA